MYIFKIKLLYHEEKPFFTKTELLSFDITLSLAKLGMIVSRLVSKGLIFSDDVLIDIQLVTFFIAIQC